MKLTPKQNAVIWCLQNGYIIITDSSMKGAIIAIRDHEFHIDNGVFYRLVNKGLIRQGMERDRFNFILTRLGKEIKTKPVNI